MIRPLQPDEVHLCVEGGKNFFDEGKIPGGFVPVEFCQKWTKLLAAGHSVILGSFNEAGDITGALGAVLCPSLTSGKLMAVESFWFVIPQYRGHGIRLLDAFEKWGESRGATMLCMIHLSNLQPDALKSLYERRGYREIEVNYLKEL